MIANLNIFVTSAVNGQYLFEMLDNLSGRLAVPNAVAGQYDELDILVQRSHDHVGIGRHHVIV